MNSISSFLDGKELKSIGVCQIARKTMRVQHPSEIDHAYVFVRLSLSLSLDPFGSSSPDQASPAIYKQQRGAGSTRGFPRTDSRANLERVSPLCVFPCFQSPHLAKSCGGTRGWTRRISQCKHRGLSSRAIHLHARAQRDYLRNEKHSSCCCAELYCYCLLLGNFLLEHRHVEIMCVYPGAYYFDISRGREKERETLRLSTTP